MADTKAPAFPLEDKPVAQRGRDYYLGFARAFHWWFQHKGPKIFYNQRDEYQRNRLYSQGLQDPAKYKKQLSTEESMPTYVQLDYTVVQVWPKFRDIILSKMRTRLSDVIATPLDALSQEQEQGYRNEQLATIQNQDVAQGLAGVGVDVGQGPTLPAGVTQAVPMEQPQTPEELELFMQMAYKPRRAMAVEIGTDVVLDDNGWPEVRRQLEEDVLDCGVAVAKDCVDPVSGRIRVRRCDPANIFSGWSSRSDFRDVTRMGELLPMSVADILVAGKGQLQPEDETTLKSFVGRTTSTALLSQQPLGLLEAGSVLVFDCEWLGKDALSVLRRDGSSVLAPQGYAAAEGEEVRQVEYEQVFRCKWVVGTNIVFDYGVAPNQRRDRQQPGRGQVSFNAYGVNMMDMRVRPFTSRVVPIVDDYQLTRIKMQHLVATAKPKGIMVEYGSLSGVMNGEDEIEPLELLRIYDQTGNALYNRIDLNGDPLNGAPIKEMENGLAADAYRLPEILNHHLDQLRMVTGLNEVSDASAPAPSALNGTSQVALQGTNLALQPLYDADDILLEKTARSVVQRLQSHWQTYAGRSYYVRSMGRLVLQTLEEDPGISVAELGIKIEAQPGDALRQQLEADIQAGLAQRAQSKDGTGGIEPEDASVVRRLALENVKLAEQYLVLRRKRRAQEDMRKSAQLQQQNQQTQAQSAQQAAELQAQQEERASQLRIQEAQAMSELRMKEKTHATDEDIRKLNIEGQIKAQVEDLKGDIQKELVEKNIELFDVKTDHRSANLDDGTNKTPTKSDG